MIYKVEYLINENEPLVNALTMLNKLPYMLTLFVTNDKGELVGTLMDGDIRRGLIKGLTQENKVLDFMFKNFTFLNKGEYDKDKIDFIKEKRLKIIPVLNNDKSLFRVINFNKVKTILPIDAVIMAGGVGSRLMPLTKNTPKPMLKIGDKPIMEYNVDLLKSYGISHLTLSVNYLKEVIKDYYKDGSEKEMSISYVTENEPLGTIGAVKQIKEFHNDYVLVMNSDLLTNVNLEQMFSELITNNGDMIIATTDYKVQVPYGVVESDGNQITALKEKPTYTYYSNAGIYIFKRELVDLIPSDTFFNATDLLDKLLICNKKILHYSINNYWLDIGKHVDFEKAKKDVSALIF